MGIRCADSLVRDTQPKAKAFQTRHLQQLDGFANHMAALEYTLQGQLPLPKRLKNSTQRRDRHSLDGNLETRGET